MEHQGAMWGAGRCQGLSRGAVWGLQVPGSNLRSILGGFRCQGVMWGSVLGRVQVLRSPWGPFRYQGVICEGTLGVLNVPQSDGEQRLGDIVCIWGTFWGSSLSPSPCSPAAMFSAVTPLPGRTLLGPPSAEPPTFARTGSDFADRSQPFRLGERSFSRQYAHLYATRLLCMRPRLEQQARLRWGEPPHPPSVPLTLIVTPQPVAAPHCSLFPEGIPPQRAVPLLGPVARSPSLGSAFLFGTASCPPGTQSRGCSWGGVLSSAGCFLPPGDCIPGVAGAVPNPHLPALIPSQYQTLNPVPSVGTAHCSSSYFPPQNPAGSQSLGGYPRHGDTLRWLLSQHRSRMRGLLRRP